jgi:hypothetical protein
VKGCAVFQRVPYGSPGPYGNALAGPISSIGVKGRRRCRGKRYAYDDPDNPEHMPEIKAEVDQVARLFRNRFASQHALPRPNPDDPIPRWLWKRSYRMRNRYHSLEDTLVFQGLWGYR